MRFADVVGQQELKRMLVRGVEQGRVSHAQLFSGASGYGALPLALAYAQYVNCTNRADGDSCGVCASCVKMSQLAHPDLHFVYPTNSPERSSSGQKPLSDAFLTQWSDLIARTGGYFGEQRWYDSIEIGNKQGLISRNESDEIIRKLSFKSFEARYKIVLVWLPERMNDAAANTLLKILEEPWEDTLFLLVSCDPAQLLTTIISRTQEVMVPRIDEDEVAKYLTLKGVAVGDQALRLAHLSCGDLLQAIKFASTGAENEDRENFENFTKLMRFSYNDRHLELLEWADAMSSMSREEKKSFFAYSIRLLRESYMMNAGLENITYLYGEEQDFCKKFSPFIGNHNIESLVRELELASAQIAQNGNPKMVLSHMALTVSKMIVRLK